MAKYKVLYNPKGNNGAAGSDAKKLSEILKNDEIEYVDVLKVDDYDALIGSMAKDEAIILAGGDGTLNHFINDVDCDALKCDVYLYALGTGNDFLRDIGEDGSKPVKITKYIKHLPTVEIDGKVSKFINGVGYGIDGYCCEEGDRLRALSDKPINYTSIAIKGLLFKYKPTAAKITIDGKHHTYKKVWLAPTMHGRYYGGGMNATPDQKRGSDTVSTLVFEGSGKIKTLMIFPNIFKGTHIKSEKNVHVFSGKNVTVEFDRPTALQIDGETVLGVTKYTVKAAE